ncbi:hypothetical protein DPMN_037619 [Dreissena polymorpha]|uniref:Uncharacterized protein n=1 Tax=Dreissena polymorpha TaxID=45954 RepID=A0A9D4MFE7_DREPO|nr:hypothetical protein DPMN_037619 [Dreissena polymorpha]
MFSMFAAQAGVNPHLTDTGRIGLCSLCLQHKQELIPTLQTLVDLGYVSLCLQHKQELIPTLQTLVELGYVLYVCSTSRS